MADQKISALTNLTNPASGDLIPIVDISDTTDDSTGTTKHITIANLPHTTITVGFSGADYICDGVADDVQIQEAINSLNLTGGTVFIKQGNYVISNPIEIIKAGINLIGEAIGGGKYITTNATLITASSGFSLSSDMVTFSSLTQRNTIENLMLDGNNRARDGLSQKASANYAKNIHILNCVRYGINIAYNNGSSNYIYDAMISYCGSDGIYIAQSDCRIINADIFRNNGSAININSVNGVQILNSHFFKNKSSIILQSTQLTMIESCEIEQNENDAIIFDSTQGAIKHTNINGCLFFLNGEDINGAPSAGKHIGFITVNNIEETIISGSNFDVSTALINNTTTDETQIRNFVISSCTGLGLKSYVPVIPQISISSFNRTPLDYKNINTQYFYTKPKQQMLPIKETVALDFSSNNRNTTTVYSSSNNEAFTITAAPTFTKYDYYTGVVFDSTGNLKSNNNILANFHTNTNMIFHILINQPSVFTDNTFANRQIILKSNLINNTTAPTFQIYLRNSLINARYIAAAVDVTVSTAQILAQDFLLSVVLDANYISLYVNGSFVIRETLTSANRSTALTNPCLIIGNSNDGKNLSSGEIKYISFLENVTDLAHNIVSTFVNTNEPSRIEKSKTSFITSGTAAPTSTPEKVGDIYVDTTNHKLYFADGTINSSNWVIAN